MPDKFVHLLSGSNRIVRFPKKCASCGLPINQMSEEKVHLGQVYALRDYTFDAILNVPYCAKHVSIKNQNDKIAAWSLAAFVLTFLVSAIILFVLLKEPGVLILCISVPASFIAAFATFKIGGGKDMGFSVNFANLEKTHGVPILSFRFTNEEIAEEFKQLNNATLDSHEIEFVYGIKKL